MSDFNGMETITVGNVPTTDFLLPALCLHNTFCNNSVLNTQIRIYDLLKVEKLCSDGLSQQSE